MGCFAKTKNLTVYQITQPWCPWQAGPGGSTHYVQDLRTYYLIDISLVGFTFPRCKMTNTRFCYDLQGCWYVQSLFLVSISLPIADQYNSSPPSSIFRYCFVPQKSKMGHSKSQKLPTDVFEQQFRQCSGKVSCKPSSESTATISDATYKYVSK